MSVIKITVYEVADMYAYRRAFGLDLFPKLNESMLRRISEVKVVSANGFTKEHYANKIKKQIKRAVCYNIPDCDPKHDEYSGCYYVQIDHFDVNGFAIGRNSNPTLIFKYEAVNE